MGNLKEFTEGLVDEDERDEDGEDFLGEAGDVAHQEAAFHRHDDHHNHDEPHAHPDATHNVLKPPGFAKLKKHGMDKASTDEDEAQGGNGGTRGGGLVQCKRPPQRARAVRKNRAPGRAARQRCRK